jgi:glyoxylate/hydroxypyruvate reductase A
MKLYISIPLGDAARAALAAATARDDVWFASHPPESTPADRAALAEAEVVLGTLPPELVPVATRLRWVQLPSVGLDAYRGTDWAALNPRVVWTNLKGVVADAMAQTLLAGLLALDRGLDRLLRHQTERSWQKALLHENIHRLHGDHVLLLGGGATMRRLQALLQPFECTFTVYARTTGDISTPDELDTILPRAGIVAAALPDVSATRGLLDARRLALLRPDALFANAGRGTLVDEEALQRALRAGRLRGAVIDVTMCEPLPPDDPWWGVPNVILTQHTAAGSTQMMTDVVDFFLRNLQRHRDGASLVGTIDWSRGY